MGAATSYAVLWRSGAGALHAGRLQLAPEVIALDGASASGETAHVEIRRREIRRVRIGRGEGETIDRRPVLVVERAGAEPLLVTDAIGVGAVRELVDTLSRRPVTEPTR